MISVTDKMKTSLRGLGNQLVTLKIRKSRVKFYIDGLFMLINNKSGIKIDEIPPTFITHL